MQNAVQKLCRQVESCSPFLDVTTLISQNVSLGVEDFTEEQLGAAGVLTPMGQPQEIVCSYRRTFGPINENPLCPLNGNSVSSAAQSGRENETRSKNGHVGEFKVPALPPKRVPVSKASISQCSDVSVHKSFSQDPIPQSQKLEKQTFRDNFPQRQTPQETFHENYALESFSQKQGVTSQQKQEIFCQKPTLQEKFSQKHSLQEDYSRLNVLQRNIEFFSVKENVTDECDHYLHEQKGTENLLRSLAKPVLLESTVSDRTCFGFQDVERELRCVSNGRDMGEASLKDVDETICEIEIVRSPVNKDVEIDHTEDQEIHELDEITEIDDEVADYDSDCTEFELSLDEEFEATPNRPDKHGIESVLDSDQNSLTNTDENKPMKELNYFDKSCGSNKDSLQTNQTICHDSPPFQLYASRGFNSLVRKNNTLDTVFSIEDNSHDKSIAQVPHPQSILQPNMKINYLPPLCYRNGGINKNCTRENPSQSEYMNFQNLTTPVNFDTSPRSELQRSPELLRGIFNQTLNEKMIYQKKNSESDQVKTLIMPKMKLTKQNIDVNNLSLSSSEPRDVCSNIIEEKYSGHFEPDFERCQSSPFLLNIDTVKKALFLEEMGTSDNTENQTKHLEVNNNGKQFSPFKVPPSPSSLVRKTSRLPQKYPKKNNIKKSKINNTPRNQVSGSVKNNKSFKIIKSLPEFIENIELGETERGIDYILDKNMKGQTFGKTKKKMNTNTKKNFENTRFRETEECVKIKGILEMDSIEACDDNSQISSTEELGNSSPPTLNAVNDYQTLNHVADLIKDTSNTSFIAKINARNTPNKSSQTNSQSSNPSLTNNFRAPSQPNSQDKSQSSQNGVPFTLHSQQNRKTFLSNSQINTFLTDSQIEEINDTRAPTNELKGVKNIMEIKSIAKSMCFQIDPDTTNATKWTNDELKQFFSL